jgi:hypothetical protein
MRTSIFFLKLYQYARKRFLQEELDKVTDMEKDKEICTLIAFIVEQGLTTDYRVFKDMLEMARKDEEVTKAMKREKDE